MLTLVAAVEVYDRASDGLEIVDCVSALLTLLGALRAVFCEGVSRKAMSCTSDENDMMAVEVEIEDSGSTALVNEICF
jgi:hypothetical protein